MYKLRGFNLFLANSTPAFLKTAFLVALALCSSLCFAVPQELVLNGGFESGSGSPDNWASRGNGGYAVWKNDNWGQTGHMVYHRRHRRQQQSISGMGANYCGSARHQLALSV